MTKSEHLRRIVAGEQGVPPAVGCWYHFPPADHPPLAAVEAHLGHLEQYDLDFVKVMNEVGYPREAFGTSAAVRSVEDLNKLRELPGDGPPFDQQLDLIRRLSERLGGRVAITTTVFNAWAVLRRLTRPPPETHGPPTIDVRDDPRDALLTGWLREDRAALGGALDAIGRTLANFARACIQAGADGIYLATRDDWVDSAANRALLAESAGSGRMPIEVGPYDALVARTDRAILAAAAAGWLNVLHLCGRPLRFERFLTNPHVNVVHWADRLTGPSIADARQVLASMRPDPADRPVLAAGVNNLRTLPHGTPAEIAAEVADARRAAAGQPIIIAPGCTYDPEAVASENIRAMVAAARQGAQPVRG